jgi:hypothetical protein
MKDVASPAGIQKRKAELARAPHTFMTAQVSIGNEEETKHTISRHKQGAAARSVFCDFEYTIQLSFVLEHSALFAMNTEKDNDTSKASLEAPRDVEMTTNDITTTDAAASEPQPSTTSTTNEALATTAKPTTAIATPTKEVSKMSQAVAKAGTKLARSGCNCQGSCLVVS